MALSTELLTQFAKVVVKKEPRPESITVTGTAKLYDGKIYVQIDGSNGQLTPIASSTVGMADGDRVTVQIKNHSATVTGNATDPSPGKSYADDINNKVDNVSDQISEFEIIVADKVDVDQLNAVNGRIDNLVSENVTITGKLDAAEAEIDDLQAKNVTITGQLDAANADIDHLEASKADISVLESEYATIKNLEATNANIHNLEADYGSFKELTTNNFSAVNGSIENLEANKLDVTEADIKYANIDFTNIGVAAVEELFAKSGIIEDLIVSGGHITGELVGVTIKGDLIEGNTIKADKLVVLGSDGLYYKLNVNAETVGAEQTEYNSLNGSIITANTITAEKINVNDLVAFNATIGGYHITDGSLYSGAKASATNTTRGVFMGDDGQFAVGDSNNYLRFINDNGTWKLEISAASIKMGGSSSSLDQEIEDLKDKADTSIKTQTEQFYLSTSPTTLNGGTWSATAPTWQNGKYIWRRTLVTYQNGSTAYLPSANGVCITGNTGAQGAPGTPGEDGTNGTSVTITSTSVTYQAGSSGTTVPTGTWNTSVPSVAAGQYLWTKTVVNYSTGTSTTSYSVGRMGQNGANGAPGAAGAPGADGQDGNGIKSKSITYQAGTSQTTAPTGTWTSTIPKLDTAKPYLWTRTIFTYDDNSTTTAYSVSSTLDSVEVGGRNLILKTATFNNSDESGVENGVLTIETASGKEWCQCRLSDFGKGALETDGPITISYEYMLTGSPVAGTTNPYAGIQFSIHYSDDEPSDYLAASFGGDVGNRDKNVWTKFVRTYERTGGHPISYGVIGFWFRDFSGGAIKFRNAKVELGNKATSWTPAPEDVQDGIDAAQDTADNALGSAEEAIERVSTAEVSVDSINATIQNLVRGQNGETLMTIDEDGVHFDFASFQSQIANALDGVETVEGDLDAANSTIDSINHQVSELNELKSYITMGDDTGTPFIELGSKQGDFKVRITNTEMAFMQGTQKIAYITNKQLYIQSSVVTDELKIGDQQGYIWKRRSNGHMGLRYVTTN